MLLSKFLDPKNDFAFKQIFGTEKNKDILVHFINDIMAFEGSHKIHEVKFLHTSQNPEIAYKKQSLVDVLCTDQRGHQYIIEMQVARTSGFEKRAQYYAAKAYSRQLNTGEDYTQLKAVIFIAITDFIMLPNTADYRSTHIILDEKTYTHDLKDFSYTFLELPKFHKTIDELHTLIEKWMYFFKHAEETREAELMRIVGGDEIIHKAYEALNRFSWTEIELNTYEQQEKRERDAMSIINQKLSEAEARGEAKGEAKGKAEIIQQTLRAIELFAEGKTVEEAYAITGLDINILNLLHIKK